MITMITWIKCNPVWERLLKSFFLKHFNLSSEVRKKLCVDLLQKFIIEFCRPIIFFLMKYLN